MPFLLVVILAVAAAAPLRRQVSHDDARVVFAAVGAGLLLLAVWPWSRYVPEGQTDFLVAVLSGERRPDGSSPRFLAPAPMELMAWVLGRLPGVGPGALFVPAAIAAVVWTGTLAVAARLSTGRLLPGLLVVLLLALDPQRLAWGHAGYHVMHPTALLGAAALLAVGSSQAEGRASWMLSLGAGLWLAAACSIRIDAAAWGPLLAGLALGAGRRKLLPPALMASSCLLALVVLFAGTPPDSLGGAGWTVSEAGRALSSAAGGGGLLWPWTHPIGLLAIAGLLLLGGSRQRLRLVLLGLGLAVGWLTEATFLDFGERHLLPARGFIALGIAWVVAGVPKELRLRAWAPLAVLCAALLVSAASMRARYYAPWPRDATPPHLALGPFLEAEQLDAITQSDCAFVSHTPDPFEVWDISRHRDLLHMLDPLRARITWERHDGCVYWARDHEDRLWNEGVRAVRSARLDAQWTWEPVGHTKSPAGDWIAILAWRDGEGPTRDTPDAACLRWAHSTCDWIESCGLPGSVPFPRNEDCRFRLEERCRTRPDDPEVGDIPQCDELGRACAADGDLARRCWEALWTSQE